MHLMLIFFLKPFRWHVCVATLVTGPFRTRVTLCGSTYCYQSCGETYNFYFDDTPKYWGSRFLRNLGPSALDDAHNIPEETNIHIPKN